MSHSVRIAFRRGQQIELDIQEVSEGLCRIAIHDESGADEGMRMHLTVGVGRVAHGAEGHADVAGKDAASGEQVGEDRWNSTVFRHQQGLVSQFNLHQSANIDRSSVNAKLAGVEPGTPERAAS